MLGTILLLIFTLIVVPVVSLYYGTPLTELQIDILWQMSYVLGGIIVLSFIVGELTKNNSQVDKLWSVLPIYYVWHISYLAGMPEKMLLMSVLVTIWGARLTYNFARRGGYSWKFWTGEEDYRWEVLRKKPGFSNKWVWLLFNLFFICGYQLTLIFLFTLPILYVAGTGSADNIDLQDWILAVVLLTFVVIEFIADQQQYDFQTEKYRRIQNNELPGEYEKGFISYGLWGIVRHPNYAMEQAIWIVFYLFSVSATGEWINWSVTGSLLLVILFKSSSDFSESISAEKYPDYKNYQKTVPRFVPFTKGRYV